MNNNINENNNGLNPVPQTPVQPSPSIEPVVEAPGMNAIPQQPVQAVSQPEPAVEPVPVVEVPGMSVISQQPVQAVSQPEPAVEPVPVVEAPGMNVVAPVVEAPGVSNITPNQPKKSGKGKFLIILLVIILLAAIVGGIVFFMMNDDDKKEETPTTPSNPSSPIIEKQDWDPSTSKIVINPNATKLTCTSEELFNGMTNKITYIHLYEDGVYTQVVVEDEIIFTDDTIQYYDYYVGSALEEVEYESELYDNITIEVREKKDSVSLAYSFDLTASAENPKNFVKDKDLTIEEMTSQMLNLGFKCE